MIILLLDILGKCTISVLVDYEDEQGVAKTMELLGTIYIPNRYNDKAYSGIPYEFTTSGNYYVRCVDENGNESDVDFVIQK